MLDRGHHLLPFSPGVMATSLLATGVPYRLASVVQQRLLMQGFRELDNEQLVQLNPRSVAHRGQRRRDRRPVDGVAASEAVRSADRHRARRCSGHGQEHARNATRGAAQHSSRRHHRCHPRRVAHRGARQRRARTASLDVRDHRTRCRRPVRWIPTPMQLGRFRRCRRCRPARRRTPVGHHRRGPCHFRRHDTSTGRPSRCSDRHRALDRAGFGGPPRGPPPPSGDQRTAAPW